MINNNIDKQYQALLQDILENGVEKDTRNGKTLSVFGRQIRYKFKDGKFPLLTTKKMYWKGIVTELLWFLRGDTGIKYLVDNDCHIWDGDCYKNYINDWRGRKNNECHLTQEEFINKIKTDDEFAVKWGSLGKIYGAQWRRWKVKSDEHDRYLKDGTKYREYEYIDQIKNAIDTLKNNPDSRRIIVSAWNVADIDKMVLPPCHNFFQVYTRELTLDERKQIYLKTAGRTIEDWSDDIESNASYEDDLNFNNIPTRAISLMFNMRSNDVPLGLPFNIASYGLLLEIIGRMVNMVPDELIANLGDAHIYKNQIDGVKEQLTREPMKLPNLIISDEVNFNGTIDEFLETCNKDSFKLDGYESHPSIKMPLSN